MSRRLNEFRAFETGCRTALDLEVFDVEMRECKSFSMCKYPRGGAILVHVGVFNVLGEKDLSIGGGLHDNIQTSSRQTRQQTGPPVKSHEHRALLIYEPWMSHFAIRDEGLDLLLNVVSSTVCR